MNAFLWSGGSVAIVGFLSLYGVFRYLTSLIDDYRDQLELAHENYRDDTRMMIELTGWLKSEKEAADAIARYQSAQERGDA